jgi:phospholipid transport system substrate-binding protein
MNAPSVTLFVGVILTATPELAASASPRDQLETFFRRATTILDEASSHVQAEDDIRRLAHPLFDVRSAAQRVLDAEWKRLSAAQREEFIRLFGDRLLRAYLGVVRGLLPRSRPPTVRVLAEEIGAGGLVALVRTAVTGKDGADVRFDYVMTRAGPKWLVRDVLVDGVGLVDNYRAQVGQVLRTSSYAGLVSRLRAGAVAPALPVATRRAAAWKVVEREMAETP